MSSGSNDFFREYLEKNVVAARTITRMHSIIEEFKRHAADLVASKCIDGRVHGSKGKGYPPTTATFSRTEGNRVNTDSINFFFWKRIDEVVIDAERNTPGKPALFIALGHHAILGHGCAAHGEDDEKALATVREQATQVRERYDNTRLYVLYGMTNTDDGTETLYFPNGTVVSAHDLIEELHLHSATDSFDKKFLESRIADADTDRFVHGKTPSELFAGPRALVFNNLQLGLAIEAFLVREIEKSITDPTHANTIVAEPLFSKIVSALDKAQDVPARLRGALAYQIFWNVTQGVYQRRRLESMSEEERHAHLEHNESVVGYGNGYEAQDRNSIILVKPGRGDDRDALKTARVVLENNRAHNPRLASLPTMIHINVELTSAIDSWLALNTKILSELQVQLRPVREVFGKDVSILTTYSYRAQKLFYPVHVEEHCDDLSDGADDCYPTDLARGFNEQNFSPTKLKEREEAYANGGE